MVVPVEVLYVCPDCFAASWCVERMAELVKFIIDIMVMLACTSQVD